MNYQENYEYWKEHLPENDPLYAELLSIENDEAEKEDRFYQDRLQSVVQRFLQLHSCCL